MLVFVQANLPQLERMARELDLSLGNGRCWAALPREAAWSGLEELPGNRFYRLRYDARSDCRERRFGEDKRKQWGNCGFGVRVARASSCRTWSAAWTSKARDQAHYFTYFQFVRHFGSSFFASLLLFAFLSAYTRFPGLRFAYRVRL